MSGRVYGILQRGLHVRALGTKLTEPWRLAQLARYRRRCCSSNCVCGDHVSGGLSRDPTVCLPDQNLESPRDFYTHSYPVLSSTTNRPLQKLLFSPFSITMATATPTGFTMATTTPTCISTITSKGCPAPTPLPVAIETSSVLKKRRRKMNQHKYKKWRKKHRFLRRRLKR